MAGTYFPLVGQQMGKVNCYMSTGLKIAALSYDAMTFQLANKLFGNSQLFQKACFPRQLLCCVEPLERNWSCQH